MSAMTQAPDLGVISVEPSISRRPWGSYGLGKAFAIISRWVHLQSHALLTRRASRRLTVSETVSLGEKRFVSILCVDGEQFLVGGSSSNIVLLAKLEKDFGVRTGTATRGDSFAELVSRAGAEAAGVSSGCEADGVDL